MRDRSIKAAIQRLAAVSETGLVVAKVISMEPAKVQLINDMKVVLTEASLVVPSRMMREVAAGDEVYLMQVGSKQIYYMMDRV